MYYLTHGRHARPLDVAQDAWRCLRHESEGHGRHRRPEDEDYYCPDHGVRIAKRDPLHNLLVEDHERRHDVLTERAL